VLDLKIVGGQLLDGTGAPAVRADVGIAGDSITAVGDLSREPAGQTVDASGLTVAPGFIDMHSHSDWRLFANRRAESKIRQGVTTEVVGNCGFSPAPVSDQFREEMKGFALYVPPGMDFKWRSVKEYLRRYEDEGLALNVAQLIGHGTLRLVPVEADGAMDQEMRYEVQGSRMVRGPVDILELLAKTDCLGREVIAAPAVAAAAVQAVCRQ